MREETPEWRSSTEHNYRAPEHNTKLSSLHEARALHVLFENDVLAAGEHRLHVRLVRRASHLHVDLPPCGVLVLALELVRDVVNRSVVVRAA